MNYKILNIHDNLVDVDYGDGQVQSLANAPLDSVEALNDFLYRYGTAYEAGISKTASPSIPQEVTDLVGESFEVSIKAGKLTSTNLGKNYKLEDIKLSVAPIASVEEVV
jgi:hypothetical protein